MDGARSMFLKEARRGRTGAETPMLQSICEVIGTQVTYQCRAAADHYCSTMQSRTPRPNANSGTAASEGTVVLKLEETPSDDDLGQVVGQTVAPATQLLSGAAPIEAKSLRGKNQTPVNDEVRCVCCCRGGPCLSPPFFVLS